MKIDPAIDTLLDLDGSILDQGNGYWIKIEARRTNAHRRGSAWHPLLADAARTILGYDNAHMVKPPKKFKYSGRILAFDHKPRHPTDHGVPYEFKDAQQLINDFFADVDRILQEVRK